MSQIIYTFALEMAKIGIYGGSFNPVHFGHIGLAKWVVEHTGLDEVWLMVSPNNPLKDQSQLADEQERLEGVKRAIKGIAGLQASDFEFGLPRPSYTANTLRELIKAYPEHQFSLVIGEDNWRIFNQWKEWEFIWEHFPIFVYPRRDAKPPNVNANGACGHSGASEHSGNVNFLKDAPFFDISSTEIRRGGKNEEVRAKR